MIRRLLRLIRRLAIAVAFAPPMRAQATPANALQQTKTYLDEFRRSAGPAWHRAESRHFVVYQEEPVTPTSIAATIDSLETAWLADASLLGQPLAEMPRANVFITASRTRFPKLVPPDGKGLTMPLPSGEYVIVLVQNDS